MRCDQCRKGFANNQEVIVVYKDKNVPVNCCGEDCADKVAAKLKQADAFGGKREKKIFRIDEMSVAGCRIEGVNLKEVKDDLGVVAKMTFPESVSIDKIKNFMGMPMTLTVATYHLDTIPGEKTDAAWAEPEPMTMEHSLFKALMQNDGAEDRWKDRREIGMTDSDLTSAIGMEFGIKGTLMGDDMQACTFEGDKVLKFWHDCPINGKPTLAGKKLVDKVRDVMGIPQPVAKKKTGTKKTSKAA